MRKTVLATAILLSLACDAVDNISGIIPETPTPIPSGFALALQPVATGLSSPVYVTGTRVNSTDSRLFVVEQPGRIRIIQNGSVLTTPFLDITNKVSSGGERGLLSVVFHPSYATTRFFYVYYTALDGAITIERYTTSAGNANLADATSGKLILSIPHSSFSNHNGGLLQFGPDVMLYIGTGDGGGAGDPEGNAQNRNSLLGKMLRIDVDGGDPYAIPPNNPFVGISGRRAEIWAYGLRNPWRFAFDANTNSLYIADVGQNRFEEVNVVARTAAGVNYGWNVLEGDACYPATITTCNTSGMQGPVLTYDRTGGRCSITGGFVYRGAAIPEIRGRYFYSDYCAGGLYSFFHDAGTATEQRTWNVGATGSVTSFGVDNSGEMYMTNAAGVVFRIVEG